MTNNVVAELALHIFNFEFLILNFIMKFKRHYQTTTGKLEIAPMIDVVFLLMVYFMLTSSFIMQPGIKIELPEAKTTQLMEKKEFVVSLTKDGSIFYQEKSVSLAELQKILEEEAKKFPENILIIRGDYKTLHGKVVEVMDIAKLCGVKELAIATQPKE